MRTFKLESNGWNPTIGKLKEHVEKLETEVYLLFSMLKGNDAKEYILTCGDYQIVRDLQLESKLKCCEACEGKGEFIKLSDNECSLVLCDVCYGTGRDWDYENDVE